MADGRSDIDGRETDRAGALGAPAWVGGATLILVGLIFLGQNLGLFRLAGNWWALFLLVPAFTLGATAVSRYRATGGQLTADVRGALTGALSVLAVAVLLLFDLNWGVWWPVFLLIAGVGALLNRASLTGAGGRRER